MTKYEKVILLAIIAAAFFVRLVGIQYGLPFAYHDDEPVVVNYALAYGTGDFNPHTFNIAPLLTYVLFFIYGIFFAIGRLIGYFHGLKDFAYLYLNDPTVFYIIGRTVLGLICGTASVLALYHTGRKYFNKLTGLLAALFLAVNFLHVRDSHYIYFDIPLTLCVLLFFIKAYDFFGEAKRIDYIQLGALLGLAYSVKYQGISLLFPFFLIIIYNIYLSRNVAFSVKFSNLAWCGGAALAVTFISNPFLFINLQEFINIAQKFPYIPVDPLYHLKISLFNGCGLFMVIFGIIGMIWALARRSGASLPAAYAIFYYLLIVKVTQPGERLVLPIVPLLLLFAAFMITGLYEIIKKRAYSFYGVCILVIFLIYPSATKIYYSDRLFLQEDTRTQAYKWIKDNIRQGSGIALDATSSWFPRLEKNKEQIKGLSEFFGSSSFGKPADAEQMKLKFMIDNPSYPDKTYYLYYLRAITTKGFLSIYPCINVSFGELKSKNIDYAVLSSILINNEYSGFVNEVEKRGSLLKTFSPYKDGISRISPKEAAGVPAAAFMEKELRDRKSYGPYIKIYKIER